MNIENIALPEPGYIETSLTIEGPDKNGDYLITAKERKHGRKDRTIPMHFTQNGLNALIGNWMATARFGKERMDELK